MNLVLAQEKPKRYLKIMLKNGADSYDMGKSWSGNFNWEI